MKTYYTLILHPYDGGYLVTVPDVPGCTTGGKTIQEAIDMARDALCGCLCVYEDENVSLPTPHMPDEIQLADKDFAVLMEVDLLKYRMETDTRAVRKNVSLPAWLASMADKRNVNCSQVLQDALKQKFGITA